MRRLTCIWVLALLLGACVAGTQEPAGESSTTAATQTPATSTTSVSPTTTTATAPSVTTTVAEPRGFTVEVIGPSETADLSWVAVDVGSDDLPFASFTDEELGDLTLVHCLDPACTDRAYSTIATAEKLWQTPSVQFGAAGLPVVMTPPTAANLFLEVHDCNDRPCTSRDPTRFETSQTGWVDVAEDGTTFVGIMDGDPLFRIFRCSDAGCGQGSTEIWQTTEWVRSFMLSENGSPIMVTHRPAASTGETEIHVLQCSDQDCSSIQEAQVAADLDLPLSAYPSASEGGTSALIGSDSFGQLVLVTWRGDDPAAASQVVIDNLPSEEGELQTPAVAVGANGHPVIVWKRVYYEWETLDDAIDLMVARCTTPDCSKGTIATIARGTNHCSHGYTAVAVNGEDLPILVYHTAAGDGAVVLATCADPACTDEAIEVRGWPTQ